MDIKIGEKVVGNLYVNIQLPKEAFEVQSVKEIMDKVKGANGHDQVAFTLGDIGTFKVASFRRMYDDDEKLCIEDAVLVKA